MGRRTITIPYKPRGWARQFHESKKRWIVLVIHRRAGKTVASINHLIRDALKTPKARFAYIAPTYKQAKTVAWDYLKEFSQPIPNIKINESELRIDYPNGARITLFGADNPDSLRGIALWGVVFDEYSQQPSNIFTEIIRPALADNQGYAVWIGTPKGKNDFYKLYEYSHTDDNWLGLLLTVDDTTELLASEIEDSRKMMTEDEINQEYYCSFDAAIKGAYYGKELARARKDNRIKDIIHDPTLKVHTVWDLGVGDSTAIGFYQRVGNETRMIDYYENNNEGLTHYIKILRERNYIYGKHFAPHDIKAREFTSGKSRYETAKGLGIEFEVVPNMTIEDGITSGRLFLATLWICRNKCSKFLNALGQYQQKWDNKKGMFENKPLHDWTSHPADMHRYASIVADEMTNENNYQDKIYEKNVSEYNENNHR